MRKILGKDTAPEIAVRRLVHHMGFRYRLHVAHLPGKPDMVFTRLHKIIEVRGCFWHRHKGCIDSHIPKARREYWVPKLLRNAQRDRRNERELRKLGWDLLTVWECETEDLPALSRSLRSFLDAS